MEIATNFKVQIVGRVKVKKHSKIHLTQSSMHSPRGKLVNRLKTSKLAIYSVRLGKDVIKDL